VVDLQHSFSVKFKDKGKKVWKVLGKLTSGEKILLFGDLSRQC